MKTAILDVLAVVHPYEVPVIVLSLIGASVVLWCLLLSLMGFAEYIRLKRMMRMNNGTDEGVE